MTNALILLAVVIVTLAIGFLLRARSGRVRAVGPDRTDPQQGSPQPGAAQTGSVTAARQLLLAAGLSESVPTILHFSATWCGPCAAVRRVVTQTITKLADEGVPVLDLELDIDENPSLAKELKVMSLPTTFLYTASGVQQHRISGVPKADTLLAALRHLE